MIRNLVISLILLASLSTPGWAQSQTLGVRDGALLNTSFDQECCRISASQARQIVRNQYPNASRVIVAGLNDQARRPYWEVRVEINGRQRSVRVDANSGAII